jgi:hypothetical protein
LDHFAQYEQVVMSPLGKWLIENSFFPWGQMHIRVHLRIEEWAYFERLRAMSADETDPGYRILTKDAAFFDASLN